MTETEIIRETVKTIHEQYHFQIVEEVVRRVLKEQNRKPGKSCQQLWIKRAEAEKLLKQVGIGRGRMNTLINAGMITIKKDQEGRNTRVDVWNEDIISIVNRYSKRHGNNTYDRSHRNQTGGKQETKDKQN